MSGRERSGGNDDQDKTNNNNWFRSIPRRIKKLVTTRPNRGLGRSNQRSMGSNHYFPPDSLDPNDLKCPALSDLHIDGSDLEGGDDGNLYLMVDYMGNDEEIAMIRACSQMSK